MKPLTDIIVAIKGAGEMASAVAWRLHRANIKKIYMMEIGQPLAVRRRVCFSEAIRNGTQTVEGVGAVVVSNTAQIYHGWHSGRVAVAVDPAWKLLRKLAPDVCIDAIMAKRNLGTTPADASVVIGLGPGFQVPDDTHIVIETHRGHDLGRIITQGSATADTGRSGNTGGFTQHHVLRAPEDGPFEGSVSIGDFVVAGEEIGRVGNVILRSGLNGVVRGLLPAGTWVKKECKLGDIDPRYTHGDDQGYCATISDKARAVSGAVFEAILKIFQSPRTTPLKTGNVHGHFAEHEYSTSKNGPQRYRQHSRRGGKDLPDVQADQ